MSEQRIGDATSRTLALEASRLGSSVRPTRRHRYINCTSNCTSHLVYDYIRRLRHATSSSTTLTRSGGIVSSLTVRQLQPAVDQQGVTGGLLRADDLGASHLQLQVQADPLPGGLLESSARSLANAETQRQVRRLQLCSPKLPQNYLCERQHSRDTPATRGYLQHVRVRNNKLINTGHYSL